MNVDICTREAEVVERVTSGGWPQCADAELRAHVLDCPVCADVVVVASAMREEHARACREARVPTAGVVWWRAELRAREEAARTAARPITLLQIVAGACAIAAALTMIGLVSPWLRAAFLTLVGSVSAVDLVSIEVPAVTTVVAQGGLPLLLALGAWLVLAPVVLYFALSKD